MSADNKRLYSETEVKLMLEELSHEIDALNHLNRTQASDILRRDDELTKLTIENRLL